MGGEVKINLNDFPTTWDRLVSIKNNPAAPAADRKMAGMLLGQWNTAGGRHYIEPEAQAFIKRLYMSDRTVQTICGPFNKDLYSQLRVAYVKAKEKNLESFMFGGQEMDMEFTCYLLEFLQPHFKHK